MINNLGKGDYLLEYSAGKYVKSVEFFPVAYKVSKFSKEEIYKEIQKLDKGEVYNNIGPGGKEHLEVLESVANRLSLPANIGKIEIAKNISDYSNLINKWSNKCHSTGDTITKEGLFNIFISLWCYIYKTEPTGSIAVNESNESFTIGQSIQMEAGQDVLDSFQNFEFTHAKALSEFIDNSIASVENDIAKKDKISDVNINITFNKLFEKCQEVVISDDSGGIDINQIKKVLRAGDYKENKGLNVYGLGMKYAAFWCAKLYTISSYSEITKNKVKSFECFIGRNINEDSVTPVEQKVDVFLKQRSYFGVNNFKRKSGTIIKLYIMQSDYRSVATDKFRPVDKKLFYKIVYELTEIYHYYLQPKGYTNPEGKKLKLNLTFNYTDNIKDDNTETKANYKDSEYNIVNSQKWVDKGKIDTNSKTKKWIENYNVEITIDNKKINIPCKLYLMEKQQREYATVKLLYRGKALRNYTYIVKDEDRPTKKEVFGGSTKLLGQVGQREFTNIRGEADFTNIGKTLDGNNVNLSDDKIDEFYKLFSIKYKYSELYLMSKYYKSKPKTTQGGSSYSRMLSTIKNKKNIKTNQRLNEEYSSIQSYDNSVEMFRITGVFEYTYNGLKIIIIKNDKGECTLNLSYDNANVELVLPFDVNSDSEVDSYIRSVFSFLVTFFSYNVNIIQNLSQSLINTYSETYNDIKSASTFIESIEYK